MPSCGCDCNCSAYGNSSSAVMLNDLVLGLARTTTLDQRVASTKDGNSILADVAEPDVADRARPFAVDTLERVGADDDVGEGGAVVENEDCAVAASVCVRVAGLSTVELSVAEINAARDDRGRRKRNDVSDAGWDVQGLRGGKCSDERRELDLSEVHLDGLKTCSSWKVWKGNA
jgi:hypothetical protein